MKTTPTKMTKCLLECCGVVAIAVGLVAVFYHPIYHLIPGYRQDAELKWWQTSIMYQIYPRSFQDSNGDGIGDLTGIISRLEYLEYLGVETLWLNPIFPSPMVDFGYDVSNYKDIDPLFGTLDDFTQLVDLVHGKGMHLILDLIPNHTSDQHRWFRESCKGSTSNPYSDYYIWVDGRSVNGRIVPPNNWVSVLGGSAWEWNESRQQFYFHQYAKEQPDLNLRHPAVKKELLDVLQFWMDLGVDGFRVDTVKRMFETEDYSLNEPRSYKKKKSPHEYHYWLHPYTTNQPETHQLLQEWRHYLEDFGSANGKDIFMGVAIPIAPAKLTPYYHLGAHFPFNHHLLKIEKPCDGLCVHSSVDECWRSVPHGKWLNWMTGSKRRSIPHGKWLNWMLSSHDDRRVSSRMGGHLIDALNMMVLLLPGTPTTYYGEEIGMQDAYLSYQQTKDPKGRNSGPLWYKRYSRDPARTPMQWDTSENAGFSTADETWLPVHPNYHTINVEAQRKDPSGYSPLQLYKKLAMLRKQKAFTHGTLQYGVVNKNIFSFFRSSPFSNDPHYLVALNVGDDASTDNYAGFTRDVTSLSLTGSVVYSVGRNPPDHHPNEIVNLENLTLQPHEGIVVKIELEISDKL